MGAAVLPVLLCPPSTAAKNLQFQCVLGKCGAWSCVGDSATAAQGWAGGSCYRCHAEPGALGAGHNLPS